MKFVLVCSFILAALVANCAETEERFLENENLIWRWERAGDQIHPTRLEAKSSGESITLGGECFQLSLENGATLKSSDFKLVGEPEIELIDPEPDSPRLARRMAGRQLVVRLASAQPDLRAEWRVILRDGSSYVREELTVRAGNEDVRLNEIVLFEQSLPGAETIGIVDGSPIIAGNFFLGYEHPMARNTVDSNGVARCSFVRNAVLKAGESLAQSCVLGVTREGQTRRDFLTYLERERAHPYRPFLHYNSWFDIAWDRRKFTETECLDAIHQFAVELVEKRQVQLKSFLLDDGWDDNRTLWQFHSGFPNGFEKVQSAAEKLNAAVGVWISPFGGYDLARQLRLEYGSEQGFETNAAGFALSGPRYYERFHQICLKMVKEYGVNMFKFDGLAAGDKASESGQTRDGDAMLRLISELRAAEPNLYINQTVGTWPSPFWLLYVDSTWRGGADHDFCGKGTARQQWMTYRDAQTYQNVVQRAPLYPLNSLMLHGIICARHASRLEHADDGDFRDEVRSFFASGTQLQELYVTPGSLNQRNWDDIAEAANWSRANADVLVDTHWVGGDPAKGQVYGWASWAPRKAILALRNPDDQRATFAVDARTVFQMPDKTTEAITLSSPWARERERESSTVTIQPGKMCTLTLRPFEVMVLESRAGAPSTDGAAGSATARADRLSDQTHSDLPHMPDSQRPESD